VQIYCSLEISVFDVGFPISLNDYFADARIPEGAYPSCIDVRSLPSPI
jgi:hypothetical protein